MYKIITILFLLFVCLRLAHAQPVSASKQACLYYANGREFLKTRDFSKAIIEYREALALDKENYILNSEYAFAFYLNKQFGNAAIIIDKAMELPTADESVYQLACQIYSAKNDLKLAKKSIEAGLDKFPNSATLLTEKANLYWSYKEDKIAIDLWQKSMQLDPNMANNYYSLAIALDTNAANLARTIIYAEVYILLEPYAANTKEMKMLLLKCYIALHKQMFNTNSSPEARKKEAANTAENKYLRILKKNKYIVLGKLNLENITTLRKQAVENWKITQAENNMPALLKYQDHLLHEQLFEVYNQWLFGSYFNTEQYLIWQTQNQTQLDFLYSFFKENKLQLQ